MDMSVNNEKLPSALELGRVQLVVADLDRSLEFYRRSIGLDLLQRDNGNASLGVGKRELVLLRELAGAARYPGRTGLYHFALLVPGRCELGETLQNLFHQSFPLCINLMKKKCRRKSTGHWIEGVDIRYPQTASELLDIDRVDLEEQLIPLRVLFTRCSNQFPFL